MFKSKSKILSQFKYEILLVALLQHLYIGIFLTNLSFYTRVLWPVNMVILGLASIGVFIEKGRIKNHIKNVLTVLVIGFPILLPFFNGLPEFMWLLNLSYVLFFAFIFIEVFRFLIKPGYINSDLISAAACGMLLLIESFVFYFQIWVYLDPTSFSGINHSGPAAIYTDLVYYCTITFTTIGYGDISPTIHNTKLAASIMGLIGQFYSLVLVGILISKFSSHQLKS